MIGLTSLGFTRALRVWAYVLTALALFACIFFRPFLLGLLAKRMLFRNLRNLCLCDQGFLMQFLCYFWNWLCMVWFLDLAIICTEACGSRSLFLCFNFPMSAEGPGSLQPTLLPKLRKVLSTDRRLCSAWGPHALYYWHPQTFYFLCSTFHLSNSGKM